MEIHKSGNIMDVKQMHHDSTDQEVFVNIPSEDEQVNLNLIMPSIELEDSVFNSFISDIKVKIEDEKKESQDWFKLNQDSLWRHNRVKMEDPEQELMLIDEYIKEKLKKDETSCEPYPYDSSQNCENHLHDRKDLSFHDSCQKVDSTCEENETKKMPSKSYSLRSRYNLRIRTVSIRERNVCQKLENNHIGQNFLVSQCPHFFSLYNKINYNSNIKQEDAFCSSETEVKYFGDCCKKSFLKLDSESYENLSEKRQKLPVKVYMESPNVVENFSQSKSLIIYKQNEKGVLSSSGEDSSTHTEKPQNKKHGNDASNCIPRKSTFPPSENCVHRAHCNLCFRLCKRPKSSARNHQKLRRSKRLKNKYRKLKKFVVREKFSKGNEQKKVSTSNNVKILSTSKRINRVKVLKEKVYITNLSTKGLYGCSACKYVSFKKILIEQHIRRHTGYKPYKCDVCSYASVEKSHLNRHQWIHTDYRPHKCPLCSYEAIQKLSLSQHMKRCHSIE